MSKQPCLPAALIGLAASLVLAAPGRAGESLDRQALIEKAIAVRPHPRQLAWQQLEFTCFVHFGVNTFRGVEWGNGFEDPAIFQPTDLDTDQWCRVAKDAGMKLILFTAKHHDGFCLWPSRYTKHSVASSPWRNGRGDVMRDLAASCRKYGLKLGFYLSPADLHQIEQPDGLYGNGSQYTRRTIPRPVPGRPFKDPRRFEYVVDDYNEYFMNQLFELLTEYGPIYEVWFDGAHPKRKGGQRYTYNQWYDLIRKLAPQAVIAIKGPDVRWCGNEAGRTRPAEWSVIPIGGSPDDWDWPDMRDADLGSLERIADVLAKGGTLHWYPAETNTSIRHGWFWRDEKQRVKSVDEILDIWYRSVGGNTVFLLNVPPDRRGHFADRDVQVLEQVGRTLRETFSKNLAAGAAVECEIPSERGHPLTAMLDGDPATCWMPAAPAPVSVTIRLPGPRRFNRIVLQEQIADHSQRIARFAVDVATEDGWKTIAENTVVGYKRICRTETVTADRLRIRILDSRSAPTLSELGVYFGPARRTVAERHPIRFGVCADVHKDIMHDADTRLKTFIDRMNEEKVDFIVQLGDFARPDDRNREFLAIWNAFKGPRYHVLGNHDTDGGFTKEQVLKFWAMPSRYYSFDRRGYHFIVLDGNDTKSPPTSGYPRYIGSQQAEWLKQDLAETTLPTIIFSHQSLENPGGLENGPAIRAILEQANQQAGFRKVVACFSGHHHADYYTAINGIYYVQINSMSYEWLGSKYRHARFSEAVEKAHPWLSYTAPYRDALYAIVTLAADGTIRIDGVESQWIPPSPAELGVPKNPDGHASVPRISSRTLPPL